MIKYFIISALFFTFLTGDMRPVRAENAQDLMTLYDQQTAITTMEIPVDKPHRNADQMGEWVVARVTNAMTIDVSNAQGKPKELAQDFESYAITEYQNYLQVSGITASLSTQKLKMNAIMDGEPRLISEGVLNGTYRWLFDVPLLLSYYPSDLVSLKTKKAATSIPNQKMIIRVQVGRLPKSDPKHSDGVMVERWASATAG